MFDTPDLSAVCAAPFVVTLVGVIIFLFGLGIRKNIEKRTGKKPNWLTNNDLLLLIVILSPMICILSVVLRIGANDPAPWFAPTTANIVGRWKISPDTGRSFRYWTNLEVPDHELVFNEDGTFSVHNLPYFWMEVDTYNKTAIENNVDGSGTWSLGQIDGTERMEWILFAQFQIINGRSDDHLMRFYFRGHLPPYRIVTLDGWELIFEFIKSFW